MIHTRRAFRAFTIIELIVALAITVVMLFLINQLFTITGNSVSLGVALSDVIGAGRAVSDQIERDAQRMIKPAPLNVVTPPVGVATSGGVLVLVCQKIPAVAYYDRFVQKTRNVWSCQLMFLREPNLSANGFGDLPMTPSNDTNFGPPRHSQITTANAIKVWYGHVQKVNPDGTDAGVLGQAGPNFLATQWALGRHAMFLVTDAGDINGAPVPPKMAADYPAIARADGAHSGASIIGITPPPGVQGRVFTALTDVAVCGYASVSSTRATIVAGARDNANPAYNDLEALYASLNHSGYASRALAYTFLTERLRALPAPAVLSKTNAFPSGQVAMMHPIFMDNVTDFVLEFAGDYVDDPAVNGNLADNVPDADTNGEIIWYGSVANSDTNTRLLPGTMPAWYPAPVMSPQFDGTDPNGVPFTAFVFRHDYPDHWPYLVRLRYRVNDRRGELLGERSPENENLVPPDIDGYTGSNVGRWFEQIIKINRD